MFNKKGMIIPTLGTVFIVIIIIFLMILGAFSSTREGSIVQEGGKAISLANNVEFWKKSLDESYQIISKRTAYDLGKIGGMKTLNIAVWNTTYPSISFLREQLENRIRENLPRSEIRDGIAISWEVGNISIETEPIFSTSKKFITKVNKSFTVYDKSIESKIKTTLAVNHNINSSYFKLLYIGRRILEDSTYSSKLVVDREGLVSDIKSDFGVSGSITLMTGYINVSLTDDSCSSSGESYCLAPLTPGEGEIIFRGKRTPYNFISLNYLVKLESIPCISCDTWVNGTCGAGGCDAVTERQQTRTGTPEGCTICPDSGGLSRCLDDALCSICTSCSSWTYSGNCGASGCTSDERPQTRTGSPLGCTECPDTEGFSRCKEETMCKICKCSDETPCDQCSAFKPKYCTAEKTLIDACGAPYNCDCTNPADTCNLDGTCSACIPTTCSALGKECGLWPDGCGNNLNCGSCPSTQRCVSGVCECTPTTCSALGKECGSWNDGCGGTLNCGSCASGKSCNTNGQCCNTCSTLGKNCDSWSDGCGGTLNCGTCNSPLICDNGICTCNPTTCSALGKECGSWDDGCGGTLNCGSCSSGKYCLDGACVSCTCGWNEQYQCGGMGCTVFVFWGGWWIRCECNVPGCGLDSGIGCNGNSEYDMICTTKICP